MCIHGWDSEELFIGDLIFPEDVILKDSVEDLYSLIDREGKLDLLKCSDN